jgi:hypothetical protein
MTVLEPGKQRIGIMHCKQNLDPLFLCFPRKAVGSPAILRAPFFGLWCSARRVVTTKARIEARSNSCA